MKRAAQAWCNWRGRGGKGRGVEVAACGERSGRERDGSNEAYTVMDSLSDRAKFTVYHLVMPYVLEPHISIVTNKTLIGMLLSKSRTHIPTDYANKVAIALEMFETFSSVLTVDAISRLIDTLEIETSKMLAMYSIGISAIKERLCTVLQKCISTLDESRHISRFLNIVLSDCQDENFLNDVSDIVMKFYALKQLKALRAPVQNTHRVDDKRAVVDVENLWRMNDIIKAEAYRHVRKSCIDDKDDECSHTTTKVDYMGIYGGHTSIPEKVSKRKFGESNSSETPRYVSSIGSALLFGSECIPRSLFEEFVFIAQDASAARNIRIYIIGSIIGNPHISEKLSEEDIDGLCKMIDGHAEKEDENIKEIVANVLSSSAILYKLKESQLKSVGSFLRQNIITKQQRKRRKLADVPIAISINENL